MNHLEDHQHAIAVLITDTHLTEGTIKYFNEVMVRASDVAYDFHLKKVYHLGDVFHSRKAQPLDCLIELLSTLDHYSQLGLELVSLVGNHDKIDHRNNPSFLSAFASHKAFQLVDTNTTFMYHLKTKDVDQVFMIHMMSYFDLDIQQMLLNDMSNDQKRLTERYGKCDSILLTHADIIGGKQQSGNMSMKGLTVDDLIGFNYVFSGHYHDRSQVGHCKYIGASHQHNFGEDLGKGIAIMYWDSLTNEIDLKYVKINTVRQLIRKHIPIRDLQNIEPMTREMINREDRVQIVISTKEKDLPGITKELERISALGYETVFETDSNLVNSFEGEHHQQKSILELFNEFCQNQDLDPELAKPYLK